ncbi:MAG: ornithine carbamoyltransferase [Candidatus Diapherotrites archaeon]
MKHLLSLEDVSREEALEIIKLAEDIKKNPKKYCSAMKDKTLLMIFEKPSLRTRVSFETGMTQMGGHGIYYDVATSPLGKKETIEDTGKVVSRYVDIIMARLFSFEQTKKLAENSSIPVIDALSDYSHPCQILGDLLTIKEHKKKLEGLTLTYVGDSKNNVTYSLMYGGPLAGMNVKVGCPEGEAFTPIPKVIETAQRLAKKAGTKVLVTHNPIEAVKDADVVYTDSWMSYHVPQEEKEQRIKTLMPFQVNADLMKHAKPGAVFMNCLPAMRGMEQTAEVIDGKQSIVFDQAENRLHIQKAIILRLLGLF